MALEPAGVPSRAAIQAAIDEAVSTRTDGLPYAMAAGTVSVTLSGVAVDSAAITFPASRFAVAPIVTVTIANGPSGTSKFVPRVIGATASGASVYVYTGDATTATGSVVVNWTAVQMTDVAAAG